MDQNEILTITGKNPDRHWKTTDYKMSGQLKKLENEQAELLKTFDGHLADVKSNLAQKKPVLVEKTCQCFFETYDNLKKNRQQQRQLLKRKYLQSFDGDNERSLGEKKKTLERLVEQIPKLGKIEGYRNTVLDTRKDTLWLYTMSNKYEPFHREAQKVEDELGSGSLDDSRKQDFHIIMNTFL